MNPDAREGLWRWTALGLGLFIALSNGAASAGPAGPSEMFGTTREICHGLRGDIYFLPPGTDRLPDFSRLRPVGTIYAMELNVTPRDFEQGFPGVTDRFEWFAIDFNGRFAVPSPAIYRFRVTSDDGVKVFIDNRLYLANDGIHGPSTTEARVHLKKGVHRIRVQYFQGPRFQVALVLEAAAEGKEYRALSLQRMAAPCPKTGTLRVVMAEREASAGAPVQVELILDASGSMKQVVEGRPKIEVAKEVLAQVIRGLPDDAQVALRFFGHRVREGQPGACQDTELVVPFGTIDRARLLRRIQEVRARGTTPIAYSVQQVTRDFGDAPGERIVVLVTDGKEECGQSPSAVVAKMIENGFKVRLNIVGFALADRATREEMSRIARLTGGRYLDARGSASLLAAIRRSLAVPFDVIDEAGIRVAHGLTGPERVTVPEGSHTVVLYGVGRPVRVPGVRIAPGRVTRVSLRRDGQGTRVQVTGP